MVEYSRKMKYQGIIAYFVIFATLVSCKNSIDSSYLTVVFPNMPWEYQTVKTDHWIKGRGEICSGTDSSGLSAADTITCRVKFNLVHPGKFRSYVLKSNLQSNYKIYVNGSEITQITNHPMQSSVINQLTDKESIKKYINKISHRTVIPNKLIKKKNNELLIVAFDRQPVIPGLKADIRLSARHISLKMNILKNLRQKSGTSLPVIEINTFEKEIPDEPRIKAHMEVSNPNPPKKKKHKKNKPEYQGLINIELRGSTSQSYNKKSYNVETIDSDGNNLNVSLLSLPKENDWVLYGPYIDKSMIRNVLAYNLFGKMGHYSPGTRFCELILNDEYKGIYVLTEKIKRDKNRVNISRLTKDDDSGVNLTGGYIVSIDTDSKGFIWRSAYTGYRSAGATFYSCYYPRSENSNEAQSKYIMSFFRSFEDYIYHNSNLDHLYDSIIDIQSFIDYFIINELAKNIDAYRLSTYFYKDRDNIDRKLYMGPVWDFNLSFGLPDYLNGYYIDGWIYQENENIIPFWWKNLLSDQTFRSALFRRWRELRDGILSTKSIVSSIDDISKVIIDAVDKNDNEYDVIGRKLMFCYFTGSTYTDEMNYLKFWLTERLKWMDENILPQEE